MLCENISLPSVWRKCQKPWIDRKGHQDKGEHRSLLSWATVPAAMWHRFRQRQRGWGWRKPGKWGLHWLIGPHQDSFPIKWSSVWEEEKKGAHERFYFDFPLDFWPGQGWKCHNYHVKASSLDTVSNLESKMTKDSTTDLSIIVQKIFECDVMS